MESALPQPSGTPEMGMSLSVETLRLLTPLYLDCLRVCAGSYGRSHRNFHLSTLGWLFNFRHLVQPAKPVLIAVEVAVECPARTASEEIVDPCASGLSDRAGSQPYG